MLDHKLKPEMRPKIEMELLRTKVDACHLLESKLRAKISQLERRIGSIVITEKFASLADDHNAAIAAQFSSLEKLVPQIHAVCNY